MWWAGFRLYHLNRLQRATKSRRSSSKDLLQALEGFGTRAKTSKQLVHNEVGKLTISFPTGRVGNFTPHNPHSPPKSFPSFYQHEALSDQPQTSRRPSSEKANRSSVVHGATG